MPSTTLLGERTCRYCEKTFRVARPKQLYCSTVCCKKWHNEQHSTKRAAGRVERADHAGAPAGRGNHPTNWIASAAVASPSDLGPVLWEMIRVNPDREALWCYLECKRRQELAQRALLAAI